MVKPLGRIGEHDTHWYVAWRRDSMLINSKSAGRCTFVVKPPDVIPKDRIRRMQQVHLNGGAASC